MSQDFERLAKTKYAHHPLVAEERTRDESVTVEEAITRAMPSMIRDVLENEALYPDFPCINPHDPQYKFYLEKMLVGRERVVVLQCYLKHEKGETMPAICKYYRSEERSIDYELECYSKLRKLGCPVPWFSSNFTFMGQRVLIMQSLLPCRHKLDCKGGKCAGCTDWVRLALDVLDQLKYLHQFGVHCDLKPDNIMMVPENPYGKHPKLPYRYVIIDYGGTAVKKTSGGYYRFTRNPKFTSQPKDAKDRHYCTPWHDLIELGYVCNYFDLRSRYGPKNSKNLKTDFEHPTLKRYMEYVKSLDLNKLPDNVIKMCKKILKEK